MPLMFNELQIICTIKQFCTLYGLFFVTIRALLFTRTVALFSGARVPSKYLITRLKCSNLLALGPLYLRSPTSYLVCLLSTPSCTSLQAIAQFLTCSSSICHSEVNMLSRSIATAARMASLRHVRPRTANPLVMLPSMMQTVRTYADKVVQVPQMAESITEGTLKQFTKSIGDYVEQDEEIATIETDKVSLSLSCAVYYRDRRDLLTLVGLDLD